jgi:hypothetical protein
MFHWRISEYRQKLAAICGITSLALTGPTMGAGSPFDGAYVGKRSLVAGATSARCPAEDDVSVTINKDGKELTFTDSALKKMGIGFEPKPDGSFAQIYNGEGGATISIKGQVTGDTIDADVTNYSTECTHHWHLRKEHH